MNISTLLLPIALCAATALAQDPCRRDATQLPSVVTADNDSRMCSPKQNLPAQAIAGSVHTGQLVHAAWIGPDANGAQTIYYRRSVTGGCDWEATQTVWTIQVGLDAVDTDFRLLCWGHEVWILFTTDRNSDGTPSAASNDHVWVLGSDQQGLPGSWSQIHVSNGQEIALSTTDLGADADAPEGSATSGALHVVWEYDYQFAAGAGASAVNEDVFYQRVDFVTPGTLGLALPEEVRLESTASGVIDSDFPNVSSKGDLVVVSWQDSRTAGVDDNLWNDTFIRVSADAGMTFGPEQNLTSFPAPHTVSGQRESKTCIWGQAPNYFIAVFNEDSRNGDDDIFFHLSPTNGAPGSFVPVVQISRSPAGIDSDGMHVSCTEEGTIYVAYEDDRTMSGSNSSNQAYVVVDRNSGGDFLSDLHVETVLSVGNPSAPTIDSYGNYCAVSFVDNISGSDPSAVAYSYDRGLTWSYCELTDSSMVDADQGANVAVTTRGDVAAVWMDDRNGGNAFNNLFAGGLRVTTITFDAATPAYVVRGAGSPGDSTTLLFSLTPPSCGALQLDPINGWQSNYAVDGLTFAVLSIPVIYNTTDANYIASYPGLPNAAALIGLPVYASAFSTVPGAPILTSMTDTLTLNP